MPTVNAIPVGIAGTGVSIPDKIITNVDMEKIVDTSDEWIKTRSGIEERRAAEAGQKASDLGAEAGLRAIKDAGLAPEDIDLVIVATITPDYHFPSTACAIQDKIGLTRAAAFDLSAGCSGFVYAMVTGAQFIASGLYKNVLIIGSETLTKILNWEDRSTCVLFGDAAGAVVLSPTEPGYGILASIMGSDGSGGELLMAGENGHLTMNGREVYKFAVRVMGDTAVKVIEKANLQPEDINCFIPHQANLRIIEAAAKRLKLPMEKVYVNVNKYGNTSAASIPVALHEARKAGIFDKGDNLVLVGFGAGLTWAAAALRWNL